MRNFFALITMFCAALVARPALADEEPAPPPYFLPPALQPQELHAPPPGGLLALTLSGAVLTAGGVGASVFGGLLVARKLDLPGAGDSLALSTLVVSAQALAGGLVMLGVGAKRIVRYQKAMRLAYKEEPRALVLGKLYRQMRSDRLGLIVTGTLAAVGAGAVLAGGVAAAFGRGDGIYWGVIPGGILTGAMLFPVIGLGSSYASEKALLSGGSVVAPVQLSLAPSLSRELYGLAISGRF